MAKPPAPLKTSNLLSVIQAQHQALLNGQWAKKVQELPDKEAPFAFKEVVLDSPMWMAHASASGACYPAGVTGSKAWVLRQDNRVGVRLSATEPVNMAGVHQLDPADAVKLATALIREALLVMRENPPPELDDASEEP